MARELGRDGSMARQARVRPDAATGEDGRLEFRVLAPLEVLVDGRSVTLVRRKERCLLAVLLLQVGRPIAVDRLAELLWNGHPPEYARRALQTYVSRLRTALDVAGAAPDVIRLVHPGRGYAVHTDLDFVDADRFRRIARPLEQLRQTALELRVEGAGCGGGRHPAGG